MLQQAAQDQLSGNVLLACGGQTFLATSTGMADRTLAIPNTIDTLFALASVTKAITATAVLQLAQSGAIALEVTLGT